MRRVLIALTGSLAGLCIAAGPAQACSCVEDPDAKETLRGFDAAATMRLIDVKNRDPSNGSADLVYKITRVYKNKNLREGEKFVIRDNPQGSACGLPTTQGKRYGLRLYRTRDGLRSNLCVVLSPRELRRAAQRSGNARMARSAGCAPVSSAPA